MPLIAALSAGCSQDEGFGEVEPPATFIEDYEVVLENAPEGDIADVAEAALEVYLRQDDGANSRAFLVQRAQGDLDTLRRLLRSRGYFEGDATVEVSPPEAEEVTLTFRLDPGPRYTLADHRVELTELGDTPPQIDLARLGSPIGGPAVAEAILQAETRAVGRLRLAGFAYARFSERDAVADPETKTIEVTSLIQAGRRYDIGAIGFEGVTAVEEDYLRTYFEIAPGEQFNGAKLRETQRRLRDTGLFTSVRIARPPEPPADGILPLTIRVEERKPRTVTAGLRYDTDEGPEAFGRLTHRNLLGRNETATAEAITGLEEQTIALRYREPQYLRDRQALVASIELGRENSDAFDALTTDLHLGLERELTPRWTVGLGVSAEFARIRDEGETTDSQLFGLPAYLIYDSTDDPLDPKEGLRARLETTPYTGFSEDPVGFFVLDVTASTYVALTRDGAYVLALRGRAASIVGATLDDVPATKRLYGGGDQSVRGYAEDFVGPLDPFNDPVGGRAALEAGVELRARIWGDLGGVVFIDAGSITEAQAPDFRNGIQVAAGLGLRYYSPVGPLRFDVGVPLDARDADDPFQFYISIGQAF
ncbi:MAG: autotransporter assembly complex family protein [Pseudomonadota bacterium]